MANPYARNPKLVAKVLESIDSGWDRTYSLEEVTALQCALTEAQKRCRELDVQLEDVISRKVMEVPSLTRSSVWRQYVFAFMRKGIEIDIARQLADEAVAYEERRNK